MKKTPEVITEPLMPRFSNVLEMNRARELLVKARELLTPESNWTYSHLARDKCGIPVAVTHRDASCFCAMGAIRRVSVDFKRDVPLIDHEIVEVASAVLRYHMGYRGIAAFNDSHTHAEVLAAFDRAIGLIDEIASLPPAKQSKFFKEGNQT